MNSTEELCRAIGGLESRVTTLSSTQNKLIETVAALDKSLKRRIWYDSAKIIGGAFAGGFTAILVKLGIWGV